MGGEFAPPMSMDPPVTHGVILAAREAAKGGSGRPDPPPHARPMTSAAYIRPAPVHSPPHRTGRRTHRGGRPSAHTFPYRRLCDVQRQPLQPRPRRAAAAGLRAPLPGSAQGWRRLGVPQGRRDRGARGRAGRAAAAHGRGGRAAARARQRARQAARRLLPGGGAARCGRRGRQLPERRRRLADMWEFVLRARVGADAHGGACSSSMRVCLQGLLDSHAGLQQLCAG